MRAGPRGRARLALEVVLGLAVAGMAVVALQTLTAEPDQGTPPEVRDTEYTVGSIPDQGEAPVQAAADAIEVALSSDYRSLDEDLVRSTSLMTPTFSEEFRSTFEVTVGELAQDRKAVTEAHARAAGLVSSGADRATALVFVDQVLVSSRTLRDAGQPVKVTQSRVVVGMERIGRVWKVDAIDPL